MPEAGELRAVDVASTGVSDASTPVYVGVAITALAGGLTVVLTALAFWLSYEHLQEVAAGHGLAQAPARSWAWPATVDLFIVVGELLILRASLAKRVDGWAISLATAGSGGSIALNVAGVGPHASVLGYVVAAVPPVAALLAFGALMQQVHAYLARRLTPDVEPTLTGVNDPSTPAAPTPDPTPAPEPPAAAIEPPAVGDVPSPPTGVDVVSTAVDLCSPVIYPNRVDQLIRALYGTDFVQPSTARMTAAMAAVGLGVSESTARTARGRVRARETYLSGFPTAIASGPPAREGESA
ncbi:DUF2637 domain-containing protein [Streptomyces griseocarneus]|uniref:DUF2637 domain-containing protein n=2 Tax=Streptomyces TaxID=1883 RepID=A0ABX7RV90_9ACTN|nr:DUF2637 domain-containing protein [Streptomyces griseocarneus]